MGIHEAVIARPHSGRRNLVKALAAFNNLVILKPMSTLPNLYLIGPMGAGKTSVGRQLAKLTKMTFYDSDAEIVAHTGVSISWIFEVEGEAGFRKREAEIIEKLCQLSGIVLSTGGGSIVTPSNREALQKNGIVIYLQVDLEVQLERTSRFTDTRPLLEGAIDPRSKLISLNEQREPLYESIAQLTYQTDNFDPHELATKILADIKNL